MNTEDLLKQRGSQYGEYADNARVMQAIKTALRSGANWEGLPDIAKETVDCIALKLGRIVNGSWTVEDNWKDILGYTQLVVDRLPRAEEKEPDTTMDMLGPRFASIIMPCASAEPNVPGTPADGGQHEPKYRLFMRRRDGQHVTFNELPEDDQVHYMGEMAPRQEDQDADWRNDPTKSRIVNDGFEPVVKPRLHKEYVMRNRQTVRIMQNIHGNGSLWGHISDAEDRPIYDEQGLATMGRAYDLMGPA